MAAAKCQQQIFDIAEQGSLASRYCLALEELRIEAVQQMQKSRPAFIDNIADTFAISTNENGVTFEEQLPLHDLNGARDFSAFHVSPNSSLANMTSWGQFESMVSTTISVELKLIIDLGDSWLRRRWDRVFTKLRENARVRRNGA
jgi:hypothetical protein